MNVGGSVIVSLFSRSMTSLRSTILRNGMKIEGEESGGKERREEEEEREGEERGVQEVEGEGRKVKRG